MNRIHTNTLIILFTLCASAIGAQSTQHQFPLTIKPYNDVLIYLGDASDNFYYGDATDGFLFPPPVCELRTHALNLLIAVQNRLGLERIALLRPRHGAEGLALIDTTDVAPEISYPGDFLISNQPGLGLILAAADSLPIIYIDPAHHAAGIAHAGWRSTALHVAERVVEAMKEAFGSNPHELQILFGPSIRGCCYEMKEPALSQLGVEIDGHCARMHEGKVFVDLPACNRQQLIACGVQPANITTRLNLCTMCNPQFCSYRRNGLRAGRQFSVVAITP